MEARTKTAFECKKTVKLCHGKTPYSHILCLLRIFGGYPLKFTYNKLKESQVQFDIIKPLLIPLLISVGTPLLNWSSMSAVNMSLRNYFNYLINEVGFYRTDLVIVSFLNLSGGLTSFLAYMSLVCNRKRILLAYKQAFHLHEQMGSPNIALTKFEYFKCYGGMVINTILSILATGAFLIVIRKLAYHIHDNPNAVRIMAIDLTFALALFVAFSNPALGSAIYLFRDLTKIYQSILNAWKGNLSRDKNDLQVCHEICQLGATINEALSASLFASVSHWLVCGVFCLYGASSVIFADFGTMDKSKNMKWTNYLAPAFACLAIGLVGNLFALGDEGTNVAKAGSQAAEALENEYLFCDHHKHSVTILADRLKNNSRIRPFDAFELSHESNLNRLNSLLTFMIVLVQLRIGE